MPKLDQVEEKLKEFLPPGCLCSGFNIEGKGVDYTTSKVKFGELVKKDAKFHPFGDVVSSTPSSNSTTGKGKEEVKWEVYHQSPIEASFKEYFSRLRLFALLYIDGATFVDEEDDRWTVFTLYEKRPTGAYQTLGYALLYKFYAHPDSWKMRISQFLILPPYQGQGHGQRLYQAIMAYYAKQSDICEVNGMSL